MISSPPSPRSHSQSPHRALDFFVSEFFRPSGTDAVIADLPALLSDQPWEELRVGRKGRLVARARQGICGENLALVLEVNDARPHHNDALPWLGSCLNICAAPAGASASTGQVFILPAIPGADPKARVVGKRVPDTAVGVASRLTTDGYEIEALLPLAGLGLAPDAHAFQLELMVTATSGPGTAPETSAWVHALNAHMEAEGMAQVTVGRAHYIPSIIAISPTGC